MNLKPVKIRDYKIEDNYILVKRDGSLPRRCVITNNPAKAKDKIKFNFKQNREFFDGKTSTKVKIVGLSLIAAGLNPRGLNQNETVEFSYYLCKSLRTKYNLIKWALITTILVSLYYGLYFITKESIPWYSAIFLIIFLLSLHLREVYKHPIKNLGYNKGFYYLEGCSNEFMEDIRNELKDNH